MSDVRALTLHQPWATLIATGHKWIETRSWATRHRGRLLIHAGANRTSIRPGTRVGPWEVRVDDGTPVLLHTVTDERHPLPLSAIVADTQLRSCVPMTDFPSRDGTEVQIDEQLTLQHGARRRDITDQGPYGHFADGRVAWLLADIAAIDPVHAKGSQGLWTPPDVLVAAIDAR